MKVLQEGHLIKNLIFQKNPTQMNMDMLDIVGSMGLRVHWDDMQLYISGSEKNVTTTASRMIQVHQCQSVSGCHQTVKI